MNRILHLEGRLIIAYFFTIGSGHRSLKIHFPKRFDWTAVKQFCSLKFCLTLNNKSNQVA
jgi:hypothetical protein